MALIYLIRHAQTEMQPGIPSPAWPLSPRGQEQAEALAGLDFWGNVGKVYSSPEDKAVATVRPALNRYALPIVTLQALRELSRPVNDRLSQAAYVETVAACFASPGASVCGWEPAGVAQQRIREAIGSVAGDVSQQRPVGTPCSVAVVSHGLVLALFLASLAGRPAPTADEWRSLPMPGWAAVDSEMWRLISPFVAI